MENSTTQERKEASDKLKARRREWHERYYPHRPYTEERLTVGEVEQEIRRSRGLEECPMYEPDFNTGWH